MTKPINYSNHSIPAYSGITINITNPTLNAAPLNQCGNPNCPDCYTPQQAGITVESVRTPENEKLKQAEAYGITPPVNQSQLTNQSEETANIQSTEKILNQTDTLKTENSADNAVGNPQDGLPQAYPPQYYLNNYNYIQNGEKGNTKTVSTGNTAENIPQADSSSLANNENSAGVQEEDMSSSQGIINELDSRVQEQKDLEKNGKKTRVIALTNEYIMSLENYLNNPNTEIRLMAAKEILTRLDEDKDRFDDAALNALLNKMLQDPEKLVRIAALSAFSSQLASGNDYTITLLTKIQNDPNADKEDVLQAADSLLKMSSSTEIRYKPVQNNFVLPQQVEQQ